MSYYANRVKTRPIEVMLACERSGGHVLPAREIASYLPKERIIFFVTSQYFHSLLVRQGWHVCGKIFKSRNFLLELLYRSFEALFLLIRYSPQKVIGFGGRDTFFLILWARLFFIPVAIFEPNYMWGKANKFLSLIVDRVYCGFKQKQKHRGIKIVGVPIRSELKKISRQEACDRLSLAVSTPILLCNGGSQGSFFLNTTFQQIINHLRIPFQVIHITGFKQSAAIARFYDTIHLKAKVFDFYKEMHYIYSAVDVAYSRSGAMTSAELAFFGIPSVLVPYPGAGYHQYAHAKLLQEEGGCFLLEQHSLEIQEAARIIKYLLESEEIRSTIAKRLQSLSFYCGSREFFERVYQNW